VSTDEARREDYVLHPTTSVAYIAGDRVGSLDLRDIAERAMEIGPK